MSAPWKIFPTITRRLLPDLRKLIDQITGQINDITDNYQRKDEKNQPGGYVGLETDGKINSQFLPAIAITDVYIAASQAEQDAINPQKGDVVVRADLDKSFIWDGTQWQELLQPPAPVQSVDGRTGNVTLADLYAAITHNHKFTDLIDTPGNYSEGQVPVSETDKITWGYPDRIKKQGLIVNMRYVHYGNACVGTEFRTEFDVTQDFAFDSFTLYGSPHSSIGVKIDINGNTVLDNIFPITNCHTVDPCFSEKDYVGEIDFRADIVNLGQNIVLKAGDHVVVSFYPPTSGTEIQMTNIQVTTDKIANLVSYNNDSALHTAGCVDTFTGYSLFYHTMFYVDAEINISDAGLILMKDNYNSSNLSDLNNHINNTNNPHQVTPTQIGAASQIDLTNHINDTNNPHQVTPTQIGALPDIASPYSYERVMNNGGLVTQNAAGYMRIATFNGINTINFRGLWELTIIDFGGSIGSFAVHIIKFAVNYGNNLIVISDYGTGPLASEMVLTNNKYINIKFNAAKDGLNFSLKELPYRYAGNALILDIIPDHDISGETINSSFIFQ